MEMELNKLIDKIKREGVQKAQTEGDNIINEAQERARNIIADAKRQKADIIKEADVQTRNFRDAAEKALKQSARDVLLTLRERVTEFFDRIVREKVSGQLTTEVLKNIIVKAVENFSKESTLDIEVLVNEKDRDKLKKALFSALSKEAKARLTVKGTRAIEKGFRIGEKGKESYVDFSDAAITEAFKRYLNPRLVEILDE